MHKIAFGMTLFALQATISFALGLRVTNVKIALPRMPWACAPLLIVGRTSIERSNAKT